MKKILACARNRRKNANITGESDRWGKCRDIRTVIGRNVSVQVKVMQETLLDKISPACYFFLGECRE